MDDGDGFARNGTLGVDVKDEEDEDDDDVVVLPFLDFVKEVASKLLISVLFDSL